MKIEDIMTKRVATCRPDQSLEEVARILWDKDCGSVPVVDESSRVIGMVTDRDICMHAMHERKALGDLRVEGAMAKEVLSCKPAEDVHRAEDLMREGQVRRLPVVDDDGRLQGLVSLAQLARVAMQKKSARSAPVTEEEVGDVLACVVQPRREASAVGEVRPS